MSTIVKRVWWILLIPLVLLIAQTGSVNIVSGLIDFSALSHTLPIKVVASTGALPSSGCKAGELALVTGATLGQQLYENSGTGSCTWTQQTGGGTGPTGPQGPTGPTGPAGGSFVLLEEHTASNSASLDFTSCINTASYDDFVVRIISVIPVASGPDFLYRVSTNGGSSYDTSSNYFYGINYVPNTGVAGTIQGSTQTAITLFTAIDNTTANGGISGQFNIFGPGISTARKNNTWHVAISQQASNFYTGTGAGTWITSTAINAFRFVFSSGNVASGNIRCYGIAK